MTSSSPAIDSMVLRTTQEVPRDALPPLWQLRLCCKTCQPWDRFSHVSYSRVLLTPFRPISLILVGIFAPLIAFCLTGGLYGFVGAFILHVWVLKYCYVLIEHLADGATEPPVMDADMLSPFETRPWLQAALCYFGALACIQIGGNAGAALAVALLALFPAVAALLGMGDNVYQAVNPLKWFRVIRGFGPLYLLLLAALGVIFGVGWLLREAPLWSVVQVAIVLLGEVGFFGLIGASIWLRREALGFEPSRSPERTAAHAEVERVKERARMIDEVFQLVRLGRHVDATAPLTRWLRDVDSGLIESDSLYVAHRALEWNVPPALNSVGSTLIHHLLRSGRPETALEVFEMFGRASSSFTVGSAHDLGTLMEFARTAPS
jgi:hypothetical protein